MSGTTSASIVGVNACSSPSVAASGRESGKPSPFRNSSVSSPIATTQPRLHDPQLAREPRAALLLVGAGELDAVRPEHLGRVDMQPLERPLDRVPGAAVEGDALLQLLRLRPVLDQEDRAERVPRRLRDGRPARRLCDLVLQAQDLPDRLVEVPLVDVVCRHGGTHGADGSFLA